MRSTIRITKTTVYTSSIMPSLETSDVNASRAIAWADENPIAFDIVTSTRSHIYGVNGSDYMGFQRGASLEALLERLKKFYMLVTLTSSNDEKRTSIPSLNENFLARRAKFAFEHFEDKGFKTGSFTQHAIWPGDDKEYPRSSVSLDYTPETLEEQLDRFCMWMDRGLGQTTHITVNKKTVRVFLDKKKMVAARRPKKASKPK